MQVAVKNSVTVRAEKKGNSMVEEEALRSGELLVVVKTGNLRSNTLIISRQGLRPSW